MPQNAADQMQGDGRVAVLLTGQAATGAHGRICVAQVVKPNIREPSFRPDTRPRLLEVGVFSLAIERGINRVRVLNDYLSFSSTISPLPPPANFSAML